MAYSTPSDVRRALDPSLSDPSTPGSASTAASLSDPQITDAINEADARIDSYLGGRYATPVVPVEGVVPAPVRFWSRDLAAYLCLLVWRKNQDVTVNDPVRLRAEQVVLDLTAVRAGQSILQLPVNDTQTGQSGGGLAPINLGYSGSMFGVSDFDVSGPLWPSPRWGNLDGLWHDWWPR